MKKKLIAGFVLFLCTGLFADDAKVLPARTGRLFLAPSFVYSNQEFDKDGNRVSADTLQVVNIGAALEFGITDWITAAVQWTPGINAWSDVKTNIQGSSSSVNVFGAGDLFAGTKFQIIGGSAPVKAEVIRLAFAPGVKIPMPEPDYGKQLENMQKGEPVTIANADNHVLGVGLRSYLDCVVSDNFFVNLYNEFIYYPMKGNVKNAGLTEYAALTRVNAGLASMGSSVDGEVDYGYELTFELEPAFNFNITSGIQFGVGLPINYKTSPGKKYLFSGNGTAAYSGISTIKELLTDEAQIHILTLRPNMSFFFTGWALPIEFKLCYFYPFLGENKNASHTFSFQTRAYFKI
jgi:hypothetical protein